MSRFDGRFDGKVALITGAASGMGRAIAERLAEEGAAVFGTDIDSEGLAGTEARVKEAGGRIQTGVYDVAQRDPCFESVRAAVGAFKRLDLLANVAGIVRFAHSPEMPEEEWNQVLAINLSGPFFMSQAAIPHLLETGGSIVNIASNAGFVGQAYTAAYCASKGGLVLLTRSLAMEYIKREIRVNAIAPGGTETPMVQGVRFPEGLDSKLIDRYTGIRGYGQPEEIAAAVAFLASDEARSIHGAILSVDNGMTAG